MASDLNKYVTPAEECLQNTSIYKYCNATWDTILCWPPTPFGKFAKQQCPHIFTAHPDKYVYKKCKLDGTWATSEFWKGFGHSDYTECVEHHMPMIEKVFGITDLDKDNVQNELAASTIDTSKDIATLSILAVSFVVLVTSLICLNYVLPRAVNQASQYKITRNLFAAVVIEVLINMTKKCIAIAGVHQSVGTNIVTTPVVCEMLITASELANVLTYMWLLIQVHHLKLTSSSGRLCTSGYMAYCLVGWGIPIIPTAVWALTSSLSHKVTCWIGYQSKPIMWILNAPKLMILVTSLACLVIAIRRLSNNFDMLNRSCCYRRLFYETIFCTLFYIFLGFVTVATIAHGAYSGMHGPNTNFDIACTILNSLKGLVASVLFWCFNADIRQLLETKVRRISRQQLVPMSADENEVQR